MQWKWSVQLWSNLKAIAKKAQNKNWGFKGFEPMTSMIVLVQCSTNWDIKPHLKQVKIGHDFWINLNFMIPLTVGRHVTNTLPTHMSNIFFLFHHYLYGKLTHWIVEQSFGNKFFTWWTTLKCPIHLFEFPYICMSYTIAWRRFGTHMSTCTFDKMFADINNYTRIQFYSIS